MKVKIQGCGGLGGEAAEMCHLNFQNHALPIHPIHLALKNMVLSGANKMDARFEVLMKVAVKIT
jgi:hypothetical protein